MASEGYYKDYARNNKELFEKLNQSSKKRLMDYRKRQWIAEALTYAGLHAQALDSTETGDLTAIMDRQMKKLVSLMQEENWLQLELTLAYYYNLRYDVKE